MSFDTIDYAGRQGSMKAAAMPKCEEESPPHQLTDFQGLAADGTAALHLNNPGARQANLLAEVPWRRKVQGGITPKDDITQ